MNPIALEILKLSEPAIASIVGALLAAAGAAIIAKLQKNARLANLATVAQAAEDALQAALKTAASEGTKPDLKAIAESAKAALLADKPELEAALEAELSVLVHGQVAVAADANNSNLSVNMPTIVPSSKGFAALLVVLIIGGVAVVGGITALFATGNAGQAETCIEQAAAKNASLLANLIAALSGPNVAVDVSSAISGEETLGECILVELYTDVKTDLAQSSALKAGAKIVASKAVIRAAAQAEVIRRGLPRTATRQSGTIGGTTSGR